MALATRHWLGAVATASLLFSSAAWSAAPVRMDFEGLTTLVGDTRDNVLVGTYYNGGSSLSVVDGTPVATGALPSMGVSFSSGATAIESAANGGMASVFGATRNLLLASGTSIAGSAALGTAAVYSGSASFIDIGFAEGFSTGLSFFFNAPSDLSVSVLRLDGTILASADFRLSGTALCPSGESRCQWNAATLAFEGTAYGVRFAGTAGDFLLDNVTLGQLDPLGTLITGGGTGGGGTGGGGTGGGGTGGGGTGGGGTDGGGGSTPVTPIPEPSTYLLMALGLAWVTWVTRASRQRARIRIS